MMQQLKEKHEESTQEMYKSFAAVNKQIQDIYVQMRKLSSDLFDQIKGIKSSTDAQYAIEREREKIKQMIGEAREDIDKAMKEMKYEVQMEINTIRNANGSHNEVINKVKKDIEMKIA
jgi:hypothetical protein